MTIRYQSTESQILQLDAYGKPDYGQLMKRRREALGWTREQFAEVYGNAIREKQVTEAAIRAMEEYNRVPANPKRRYIVAALLGLPPALFGLAPLSDIAASTEQDVALPNFLKRSKPIDLQEYHRALLEVKERHHTTTAIDAIKKMGQRIILLQDSFLYGGKEQKEEKGRLLCDYLRMVGNIASDVYPEIALTNMARAIGLAREQKYHDLLVLILYRRGGVYNSRASMYASQGKWIQAMKDVQAAQRDYDAAHKLSKDNQSIPPEMRGAILSTVGTAHTKSAQDNADLRQIWTWMDEADKLMRTAEKDTELHRFTRESYHQQCAEALMASPLKKLRNPNEAIQHLSLSSIEDSIRTEAFLEILHARAALDLGEYPFATELVRSAISSSDDLQSKVLIADAKLVFQGLQETSYKNAPAVGQLGTELMKAEFGPIFE